MSSDHILPLSQRDVRSAKVEEHFTRTYEMVVNSLKPINVSLWKLVDYCKNIFAETDQDERSLNSSQTEQEEYYESVARCLKAVERKKMEDLKEDEQERNNEERKDQ